MCIQRIKHEQCPVCQKTFDVALGDAYEPLFSVEPVLCWDCRMKKIQTNRGIQKERNGWEMSKRT